MKGVMTEDFNRLYQRSYADLRRLAAAAVRRNPRAGLSPTTLVHEAWLRLGRTPDVADTSPAHFKAIAARAMRQILVDEARRRHAARRGGAEQVRLSLEEGVLPTTCSSQHILDLHEALLQLREAGRDGERLEAAAVLRWFGGCTVSEIAEALAISETMVERDWRLAKAWLKAKLLR
jgi:RNA polymerase sigma-70 factor, ECF subfamily